MKTEVAGVAKVVENDDGHHEKGISHGEDVERGATEVLGPHVEVEISMIWIKTVHFRDSVLKKPAAWSCGDV